MAYQSNQILHKISKVEPDGSTNIEYQDLQSFLDNFSGGDGGGGLNNYVEFTPTTQIETSTFYYVKDESIDLIELPSPMEVTVINIVNKKQDNTLEIKADININSVDVLSSKLSLLPNEFYQLLFIPKKGWIVTMKEKNAIQGDVTHIFGFYYEDETILMLDILPVSNSYSIDISKYTVMWDSNATWISNPSSIEIENTLSTSNEIIWE